MSRDVRELSRTLVEQNCGARLNPPEPLTRRNRRLINAGWNTNQRGPNTRRFGRHTKDRRGAVALVPIEKSAAKLPLSHPTPMPSI